MINDITAGACSAVSMGSLVTIIISKKINKQVNKIINNYSTRAGTIVD